MKTTENIEAHKEEDKDLGQLDVAEIAQEQKEKRKLPPIPGKRLTFEQMQEYFSLLTSDQWGRLIIYVYRKWPIIVRPKNEGYIDCLGEPFDLGYMQKTHGGGKYDFLINDTDKRKFSTIFSSFLEVDRNKYDPILDLSELDLASRDNKAYVNKLKAFGKLSSEGNPMVQSTPKQKEDSAAMGLVKELMRDMKDMSKQQIEFIKTQVQASGDDTAVSKALDLVQKGGDRAIDMVKEQIKGSDPMKGLEQIAAIVKLVKGDQVPQKDNTDVLIKMMEMQTKAHEFQMEMMKEILGAKQEKGDDPLSTIDKTLAIIDRLKERGGNGEQSKPTLVEQIVQVADKIAPTIDKFLAFQMAKAATIPGQTPRNVTPPRATVGEGGGGMNMRGVAETRASLDQERNRTTNVEGRRTSPEARTTSVVNPETGGNPEVNSLFTQYAALVLQHITAGNSGDAFAEIVQEMFGLPTYHQIAKNGPEALLSGLKAVEGFWEQATNAVGEEAVIQFVEDFCNQPSLARIEVGETPIEEEKPKETRIKKEG